MYGNGLFVNHTRNTYLHFTKISYKSLKSAKQNHDIIFEPLFWVAVLVDCLVNMKKTWYYPQDFNGWEFGEFDLFPAPPLQVVGLCEELGGDCGAALRAAAQNTAAAGISAFAR